MQTSIDVTFSHLCSEGQVYRQLDSTQEGLFTDPQQGLMQGKRTAGCSETFKTDSSSEDNDCVDWIFYRDREEWKDVTPIPQSEGLIPVVTIAYSPKFRDVYDYFRAVLKTEEYSERALELTKDALLLNAANYTVWQYRRLILKKLNMDLLDELLFSKSMIVDHPKNYQVWHHRMVIIQWMNNPGNELKFIEQMLNEDPKNYHAWQYRQWILSTFKSFDKELDYTEKLLDEDIRNNSAWNHRYFVINHTTDFDERTLQKEIDFTLIAIDKAKKNESSWNYLRGLLIHSNKGLLEPKVIEFCEKLYSDGNRSAHVLAFLIDVALETAESKPESPETVELLKRAYNICKELAEEHDKIRHNYWMYMSKIVDDKLNKS